jgi:polyhydroxyalkanoate synthase
VFVISWVNPDAGSHENFEEYMREGVIAAFDRLKRITGEKRVHAIGYCVGGTLLAITLAYLAAKKQNRRQVGDIVYCAGRFHPRGDLMVFVDEERIRQLETHMKDQGYLEASRHGQHVQYVCAQTI